MTDENFKNLFTALTSFNFKTLTKDWTKERKDRVEQRVKELIEDYNSRTFSLIDIRKFSGVTQNQLAENLGINQSQVSRLESENDMMLSSLRSYIEALGGKLIIMAEFPEFTTKVKI